MRAFRAAIVMCVLATSAGVAAARANAANITLQPGHAYRVAGTQEIVGRDGNDLFVGILGYDGNVVPNFLWLRQNDTAVIVGRNPSGALGSAPGPAETLFNTNAGASYAGPLPRFTIDGVTQVGQDRLDVIIGPDRTIHVFVNGTQSAPVVRSSLAGLTGLIVPGSAIGVMSPTDFRVGNASNSTVAYQAQQPSLPSQATVDRAERDIQASLGWCADYPDPYDYLDLLLYGGSDARKNWSHVDRQTLAKMNALLKEAGSAVARDDYKGAHGAAPTLIKLNKQLKATTKKFATIYPRTNAWKKFATKAKKAQGSFDATAKQLELM